MAFRQLTEANCGQANPLHKLTTHLTRDHALAETHGQPFPSSSDQLVEQFLQETRMAPQTFRMDDLMREMHEIESQRASLPPVPASTVKDHLNDDVWALQYIEDGKHFHVNENEDIWSEIAAQEHNTHQSLQQDSIWAEEFRQDTGEAVAVQASANELLDNLDDPQFQYSKFMKFMKQVGDGEATIQDGEVSVNDEAVEWGDEYVNNLRTMNKEETAESMADDYVASNNGEYNSKFWDRLQDEWKKLADTEETADHPWISDFNDYYDTYKEYNFTEENPMFDILDPLSRGKDMLSKGDLPSAVLCFEAAVKKEPENAEAWQLLGTTQAENEQDPNAICALKRCVELQPENLTALMGLAVSYTNESYPRQACQSLVNWMQRNPQYASLVPPDFDLSGAHHKVVQDMFIRAAQLKPQDVDYEIQCGLGVLFNLSGEYDKAADCFRAALSVKSDDAKLWNRLGATLANGSNPEQAVDAYHRALNLEPGFIRARYNVGITCINLSAYKEAAEHFLLALNQQARGKDVKNVGGLSQMSETIWSTLRMCISLMNRSDLRPALDNRDLDALNKALDIHES
ncbi:PREDICTED: peroxisomal targeting signal 1 receptor isoform X2 [Nicrophorus vespilloides]|uniref:Peroxisomal targeting signal 1 receptor isoform X2 n=1 Tax=Nicrophorus vespilloides TaxID=110193 RepID=A0ABM1MRZ1_NICVS|nr:PREDICTED: peroxisomal targeting signal 1 receptor isoform X2 [Nicrophorus vespilloides]